eukprot:TRINITY_DN1751_c0_g1_i1.p1 TRINITY_DN1751_c0_g1~~TRINITY_DN1751_c0_g1_i1.p1  ORF type:complete len:467 (-),score=97.62 TRINITY_DN1751_c0_g1_i1:61-1461(-)
MATVVQPLLNVNCTLDNGDVAWVLTSTILVLGMVPGLSFFEAGLLRQKNTISIMTQTLSGLAILSVMWVLFGYSLTLGADHGGVIGDFYHGAFANVAFEGCYTSSGVTYAIPEAVYAIFQLMFAAITPLLITGTVAERMRWKPFLAFTIAWEMFVYYPLAHWVWGGGWLGALGTEDFAGGIVIHTSSGVSSLVVAIMLGRRIDYDKYHGEFPHSDIRTAAIGATLLWMGWFGFNAGSALQASPVAIHAVINTQVAACIGAVVWLVITWARDKPSVVGILNGAIAGMAGITPASGFINVPSAVVVAVILGVVSYGATIVVKHKLRIDDALDVSCVHGITGLVGALAIGFCGSSKVNPAGADGLIFGGGGRLLGVQILGIVIAIVFPAVMTALIVFIISKITPLRARYEHELAGLDISHHHVNIQHAQDRDASAPLLRDAPHKIRIDSMSDVQELTQPLVIPSEPLPK